MKKSLIALLSLLSVTMLMGCGTPQSTIGTKPEDQINPAMSPAMRNAKLHGHAKSAG